MQVRNEANVDVHALSGVDWEPDVKQVEVMMQRTHLKDRNGVALVQVVVDALVDHAIQISLLKRAAVIFPFIFGIFLVSVSELEIKRDFRGRFVVNICVVGDVGLENSNQVLLPSREV